MCNWGEDICLVLTSVVGSVVQDQQLSSQTQTKRKSVRMALTILVLCLPNVPQCHTRSHLNTISAIYDGLLLLIHPVRSIWWIGSQRCHTICRTTLVLARGDTPRADNATRVWHTLLTDAACGNELHPKCRVWALEGIFPVRQALPTDYSAKMLIFRKKKFDEKGRICT